MSSLLNLTAIRLGDSATPSKNFIISVPDIPDGTLTIERGDGTDVLTIDAAGKVAFPGNVQSWKNVTATRVAGTPYVNDTPFPIEVAITSVNTGPTANSACLTAVVGGELVQRAQAYGVYVNSWLNFTVPAGATYSVSTTGGVLGIELWKELR